MFMAWIIYFAIVLVERASVDVPDWIRFVVGFVAVVELVIFGIGLTIGLIGAFLDRRSQ